MYASFYADFNNASQQSMLSSTFQKPNSMTELSGLIWMQDTKKIGKREGEQMDSKEETTSGTLMTPKDQQEREWIQIMKKITTKITKKKSEKTTHSGMESMGRRISIIGTIVGTDSNNNRRRIRNNRIKTQAMMFQRIIDVVNMIR